jgi:hypothetical protein
LPPPNHVSDDGSFRRKRPWRLPPNFRDVTAEKVGTVVAMVGATVPKNRPK